MKFQVAIDKFGNEFLTEYEHREILQFDEVYYVNRRERADEEFYKMKGSSNHGFDDESNYYRYRIGD
jgi:hypothetical protein